MVDGYLSNVSFLIVEDNAFMMSIIKRVLSALGTGEVHECTDGAEALKVLKHFHADIIITDWAMDPLNGIELTKMIRTAPDSVNPYTPIIMLTAHTEMHRIVEARDAGVNEFVIKPVSVTSLFARIQAVIEKPRTYIRSEKFFGPDRRRQDQDFRGDERRASRKQKTPKEN